MGSFLYKTRWWYAENVDPDNLLGAGFFAIMYHQNDVTPPTNPTAVSLRLSLSVNDALSGVREVVFPGLFGTGTYTATLAPYERMYTVDGVTSLESFTITASDRVGNTNGTTYTLIRDNALPEIALTASSDSGLILPVSWAGSDSLSGVASYDIQVRAGEGSWTGWLTGTQRTAAELVGADGVSYSFQVRATDRVGNTSAWTTSSPSAVQGVTKYYSFNGQRVALRRGTGPGSKVYYLHGDHLGSTSLVTDAAGNKVSESRYAPFGELRWTRGASLTDFAFTGQRRDGFGLLDFNARFYSPFLGRFISADTIVPGVGNPLAWDRFAYSYNNPVNYVDPTGHNPECGPDGIFCDNDEWNDFQADPVELSENGELLLDIGLELNQLIGGKLTLRGLMRIIFERELNGFGGLSGIPEVFGEAAGRNYWKWAQDQYGTHTNSSLLNWLAGHNSVATSSLYKMVFENLPKGSMTLSQITGKSRSYAYNSAAASRIVGSLLNTPDGWKSFNPNAPYSFAFCEQGGKCMIHESKRSEYFSLKNTSPSGTNGWAFSTDLANTYFKSGISYIVTFNQMNYWNSP